MTVFFPSIRPSNRTFTPGSYPTKRFSSPAGTGTTRRFGTLPSGALLDLEFQNITDANAGRIALSYQQASGSYDSVHLFGPLWMDIEEPLRSRLKKNYIWRFAEPPVYSRSSIPGYKSVTVKLEGNYDFGPQSTTTLPIPPDPPELGYPIVVESDGRKKVQLNWRSVEVGLSFFYVTGSTMLYWYGDLYIDYSNERWLWLSDDPRNTNRTIANIGVYYDGFLYRGFPRHFLYSPEGVFPQFYPIEPPTGGVLG